MSREISVCGYQEACKESKCIRQCGAVPFRAHLNYYILYFRHWLQLLGALLIVAVSVGGCVYAGAYSTLNSTAKIVIISSVTIVDVVFFK